MQTNQRKQIDALRKEILGLQGQSLGQSHEQPDVALGALLKHMPGCTFPTGSVHEFLSPTLAASAATTGFIAALLGILLKDSQACIWVSQHRQVFPPALKRFGINPDQVIFIDAIGEKEVLWVIEESLRCKSVGAVIGEIKELDFTQSRRLQLAVENSRVTGFINRLFPRNIQPTACVARWRIQPVNSLGSARLPGLGFPNWDVELLKIRNGRPGRWQLGWLKNHFCIEDKTIQEGVLPITKAASA